MDSTASNATSTCAWHTRLCSCESGPCILTIAGPSAKNLGRHYYRCPRIPPCTTWVAWCDGGILIAAHSHDDRSCDFTGTSHGYSFDGHNISDSILAIENGVRVVMVIGIVVCVLLFVVLMCM